MGLRSFQVPEVPPQLVTATYSPRYAVEEEPPELFGSPDAQEL